MAFQCLSVRVLGVFDVQADKANYLQKKMPTSTYLLPGGRLYRTRLAEQNATTNARTTQIILSGQHVA
jgi:hypothetical protein